MPHKRNPSLSEALIHYGRTIPALASVVLDDVEAVFERDNTSRPNRTLEALSLEAEDMLSATRRLVARLVVDEVQMRTNLERTDGMIMAQRIMLALSSDMSREDAERRVREAADRSLQGSLSFRDELLADTVLGPKLDGQIDALLDPTTALGLAGEQVSEVVNWIDTKRFASGESPLDRTCSP